MSKPANRPQRTPLYARNVLKTDNNNPNKVQRIVNDVDDRVEHFINAGYTPVQRPTKVGDNRADVASQLGSVVERPVGGGVRGVLMEIDRDLYDEDQRAKESMISEKEKAIYAPEVDDPEQLKSFYGKTQIRNKNPGVHEFNILMETNNG